MTFLWPLMLLSLVSLPILIGLYKSANQRRQRLLAVYGQRPTATTLTWGRRYLPPALLLLGFTVLSLAMARPQMEVSLPRIEGTVILAFDVSGSMAADDLQPTRMEAAKAAARTFVENQPPSVLIGVVAFSDSGFIVQSPTNEQALTLATISRLAPTRGTSLANGIQSSLNIIALGRRTIPRLYTSRVPEPTPSPTPVPAGFHQPAVIILLSDGENNINPNPFEAAHSAAERGVRIYTVGIGSSAGATLNIDGFAVHTQLDEATLQQIATLTGGTYYQASSTEELRAVYDALDPELILKPETLEVTAPFAGVAVAVLLLGSALSLWWLGKII